MTFYCGVWRHYWMTSLLFSNDRRGGPTQVHRVLCVSSSHFIPVSVSQPQWSCCRCCVLRCGELVRWNRWMNAHQSPMMDAGMIIYQLDLRRCCRLETWLASRQPTRKQSYSFILVVAWRRCAAAAGLGDCLLHIVHSSRRQPTVECGEELPICRQCVAISVPSRMLSRMYLLCSHNLGDSRHLGPQDRQSAERTHQLLSTSLTKAFWPLWPCTAHSK